jgi:hypothetical protein
MPSTIQPPQPYPAYFIGHAGVGLLFSESSSNKTVQANLREIGKEILSLLPRPKAIIVFSGHFEAGEIHGPGVIEGEFLSLLVVILLEEQSSRLPDVCTDWKDSKRQTRDLYPGKQPLTLLPSHWRKSPSNA